MTEEEEKGQGRFARECTTAPTVMGMGRPGLHFPPTDTCWA